jgi:hypothetical protein
MTEVRSIAAAAIAAFTVSTAQAQQTNFAPAFSSNSTAISMVRLYNASAAAGRFTVALRSEGSSTVLASWTSTIAPHASTSVKLSDIETLNHLTPPANGRTYSLSVTSTVEGYAQHVVFQNAERAWMNFSSCGGTSSDTKTILNVHDTSQVSASVIVLHNTGTVATSAIISIVNTDTGETLGTWTSPTLPGSSVASPINASQIISEARLPAGQRPYVTFILNDAFTGYAQHLVTSVGTTSTADMTAKCALTASNAGV